MIITREFVEKEIADIQREMANARDFLVKAQAALAVHNMLLNKLDMPEPAVEQQGNEVTTPE